GHELGGRELAGQPLAVVVAVIGDDPNALRTPRRGRGRGPTLFAFDAEALRASADGHVDGPVDGDRQDETVVVVRVLAHEIDAPGSAEAGHRRIRSEEHTSE